jgi:hypothetical protein
MTQKLVQPGKIGSKKENFPMNYRKSFWCLAGLAGLFVLAAATVVAFGRDKPVSVADLTKETRIEVPAKTVVAGWSGTLPTTANASVNPKVKPGDVRWHPTFAKACEAARTSGKPVLLFHMMGKLDEQFC